MNSPITISAKDTDNQVIQLGQACGLLRPVPGEEGVSELNDSWFEDPVAKTGAGLADNPETLARLIAGLIGDLSGSSLGIPVKEPGELGTWYPFNKPNTEEPSGLYLATQRSAEEATGTGQPPTVFGVGVMYKKTITLTDEDKAQLDLVADGPEGIDINVWGLIPLVLLGNGAVAVVAGSDAHPFTMGFEIVGSGNTPLVSVAGFSFEGVRVSVNIAPSSADPISLSLVVLQLKLPTDPAPVDRTLADLQAITGAEILATASALALAALTKLVGEQPSLPFLLPALGLGPSVPGIDGVVLPILRWDEFVENAINGGPLAQPFVDWFTALASDPNLLSAWLQAVGGAVGGLTGAAATLSGSGSRQDPYKVPVFGVAGAGTLQLSAATAISANGVRHFYPGLIFGSDPFVFGSSHVALSAAAELEFLDFALSGDGGIAPGRFSAGVTLANKNANQPLFSGTIADNSYTFASFAAGMSVSISGSDVTVLPACTLNGVITPTGQYPSIDLTQPDKLVEAAENELTAAINAVFNELFGLGHDSKIGISLAALMGVAPPDGRMDDWPLTPPFSVGGLAGSIQNPVGAFSAYWGDLVSATLPVAGQPPFFYMVEALGSVLQVASGSSVSGSGKAANPWSMPITSTGGRAAVEAFIDDLGGGGAKRLVLGIGANTSIALADNSLDLAFTLSMLGLDASAKAGGGITGAQILPGVAFAGSLSGGVSTPEVAGASLKIDSGSMTVGWSPYSGWGWSMQVSAPALVLDGREMPVGAPMNYSDGDSLEKFVTDQAQTFASILTAMLGVALYRSEKRAGLALTGWLGLLPDLASFIPEGIDWPSAMPSLKPTSFDDPVGQIRKQIKSVLSADSQAKAALGLLGWAIDGTSITAAAVAGKGTRNDPYLLPLGLPGGFLASLWQDDGKTFVSPGFATQQTVSVKQVRAETTVRLDALALGWADGKPVNTEGLPALGVRSVLRGASGPLVAVAGVEIASVTLGLDLNLDLSGASPVFNVMPVLEAQRVQNDAMLSLAELDGIGDESDLFAWINAGINAAGQACAGNDTFQLIYRVLTGLGLAVPASGGTPHYGIDSDGWRALQADPLKFMSGGLMHMLANPQTQADLLLAVEKTLNFAFAEAAPRPLLALLSGLGMLQDQAHGYALNPQAVIAVLRNPAAELSARMTALMGNSAARSAVIASMAGGAGKFSFGPVEVTTANGRVITTTLPRGTLTLGAFLAPSIDFTVDLETGETSFELGLFIPQAGFSLVTGIACTAIGAAPAVTAALEWGDGRMPQPAALTVFPFEQTTFINQLAALGPAYVLSIFVAQVVQDRLLASYPVASGLLEFFGLVKKTPMDGGDVWIMKSTLGLFEDPVGWLLSDAVVGTGGQLNIAALDKLLTALPQVSGAGLTLKSVGGVVTLTGLPYGLQLSAMADTGTGLFSLQPGLTTAIEVGSGDVSLEELSFGLTLTSDFQPGLTGGAKVAAQIPGLSDGLFLKGGYDQKGNKGFNLTIGQGGDGKPTLSLVPFGSWETFALSLASEIAQKLLGTLVDRLLIGLEASGDADLAKFIENLRSTASTLQVGALINALIAAQPDPDKLRDVAFAWLNARLSSSNAAATATAVANLISQALDGVTSAGGLLSYAPSDKVPVTITAGLRGAAGDQQIGIWAQLSASAAQGRVIIALAPTGVGIPVQGDTTPVVTFGLTAQAVVANDEGPGLTVSFSSSGGITALIDPMMIKGSHGPGKPQATPDLGVELLPRLFGLDQGADFDRKLVAALEAWLLDVLLYVLPRYVSIVVLNTKAVSTWLDDPLTETVALKPGDVLVDTQLLVKAGDLYVLNDVPSLIKLGPEQFLGGFVKALTKSQIRILSFENGGGIWMEPDPAGGSAFGLRFAMPDLSLRAAPNFVFQIGANDKDWIALTGANPEDYNTGIAAYVPLNGLVPEFTGIKLRLINVGVDFKGAAGQPLVDLTRFQLGMIKPRGLVTFDFASSGIIDGYGGGIEFEDIAISLAPNNIVSGPASNAVAQNLLGSGDAASKNNPPTNPGFSARAAWLKGESLGVELYDQSGYSATRIWIPVQRSFGPVTANRIGFGWDNPSRIASVLFDGSLSLAGVTVELIDLSVSVNVSDITDYKQYSMDLAGLAVSFTGGAITIEGGLLKNSDPLRYDGEILVKASSFTVYAVGSFAMAPIDPGNPSKGQAVSLFVFLNVNAPLGGVPAFFLRGIAGGFSINRNIIVPEAGNIMDFPLIKGAISSSEFGKDATPASALATLSTSVYPEVGSYWVAAGITFTSFELLRVFAMLLVKFGREFEIDVIGVASASLPPELPPAKALAFVELAIVASFKFSEGEISVTAQLTPNSFLLVKDCRLTGGFAAKFWFGSNPNAGNFVITLGGYHPAFTPPDFYPSVPRLGFDWPVLDTDAVKLSISGGAYFALTPSMIMAGGYLKALFSSGPLKAWFDAGADFLISWQPFYYTIEIHITVGASLGVEIAGVSITLKAELGAGLQMWGPATGGLVKVNWYVLAFDIPFGDQTSNDTLPNLDWATFQKRLLPQPDISSPKLERAVDAQAGPVPGYDQVVMKVQITAGLLSDADEANDAVVQATPFAIEVRSVVPASTVTVTASSFSTASPALGIQPMGQADVKTGVTAGLEIRDDQNRWSPVSLVGRAGVRLLPISGGAPDAIWSTKVFDRRGLPSASMVDDAKFGFTLGTTGDHLVDQLAAMNLLTAFGHESAASLPLPFATTSAFKPVPPALGQDRRFAILMSTVMDTTTASSPASRRAEIMRLVAGSGIAVIVDQNLSVLARFADQLFQAPPHLAELGFDQAGTAEPLASRRSLPEAKSSVLTSDGGDLPPRYLGGTHSYAVQRVSELSDSASSIYLSTPVVHARWKDVDFTGRNALVRAQQDDAGLQVDVRHGTVAVVDLGTGKGQPVVAGEGPVPWRVYGFDEAQRLVSDMVVGADGGSLSLPPETVQAAFVGLNAWDETIVHGWNRHSTLFQVGHYTMLGEGCTVRPQTSPCLRRGVTEQRRGILSGHDLMSRNRVQQGTESHAPGWTETIFATGLQTVAVVLTKAGAADPVRVKTAATPSPWFVTYGGFADPVDIVDVEDGRVLLFDLAGLPAGPDMRSAVLVKGTGGLAGVYGWRSDADEVRQGWKEHRMLSLARRVPNPAGRFAPQAADAAAAGRSTVQVFRR
ncbi:hypothetical protein J2T09_005405 [Neorhizobium huautlense]|uniref:DUF6603 domain-containing protein n=1 Tax=Neorhizobium huautlense TaxID=67774 RepID=A0ABT9Q1L6_9HYPH|nr:DUF6603 domain-containing protein [Neorhizobium huautlense]MDP9840617.1 hypothetical protein [Neorhizobium huautlense]